MISRIQIQRMIQTGAWTRLVERILANGRCRSLPARRRLSEDDSAAVAGLGLALQRLCEITYGPSGQSAGLAERLVRLQREDGLFAAGPTSSPAATAVAIAALLAWREQRSAAGIGPDHALDRAIAVGLAALADALKRPGRKRPDRVDVEVVLWQLGRHDAFRQAVPLADLAPAPGSGGRGSGGRRRDDDLARFAAAAAA
jgi:hypothetical protein